MNHTIRYIIVSLYETNKRAYGGFVMSLDAQGYIGYVFDGAYERIIRKDLFIYYKFVRK